MAFTLSNIEDNQITITNESDSTSLIYTIHVLGNGGVFSPVDGYTEEPETELELSSSITIDLVDDGIYALISSDPDNTYYFFLNADLRECEKAFDKAILCQNCDSCNDLKFLRDVMRFLVLKERFYFIANKYIQDQSVVDLLTPDLGELIYWEDILEQLSTLCSCNFDITSDTTTGCGCD